MTIEEKALEEKALKLAEYDGWVYNQSLNSYRKKSNFSRKKRSELIADYSSFDKLMELFDKTDSCKDNVYYDIIISTETIRMDKINVDMKKLTKKNDIVFYRMLTTDITRKEALMDCLLEYYKLIGENK